MNLSPIKCLKQASVVLLAVLLIHAAPPVEAVGPSTKPAVRGGKKKLQLFAKNPSTWTIIKGGATGSIIYREATGEFTLNAIGLRPRAPYALVRFAADPPIVEILTKGVSDDLGKLELRGTWHNWTRKFWLVTGEDVEGRIGESGKMLAWHPDRYLFEEKKLGVANAFTETEVP